MVTVALDFVMTFYSDFTLHCFVDVHRRPGMVFLYVVRCVKGSSKDCSDLSNENHCVFARPCVGGQLVHDLIHRGMSASI